MNKVSWMTNCFEQTQQHTREPSILGLVCAFDVHCKKVIAKPTFSILVDVDMPIVTLLEVAGSLPNTGFDLLLIYLEMDTEKKDIIKRQRR